MIRRPGTTLLEALIAIFVMGVGLLSLLVLFPLGALSMAEANKNSRTAQAAQNATAVAEATNVRHDALPPLANVNPVFQAPPNSPPAPVQFPPHVLDVFINPNQPLPNRPLAPATWTPIAWPQLNYVAASPAGYPPNNPIPPNLFQSPPKVWPWPQGHPGPSYPIFVDPIGLNTGGFGNPATNAVGQINVAAPGFSSPGIPRHSVSFVPNPASAYRWFSLLDDIEFGPAGAQNGTPRLLGPNLLSRAGRYSWAYMLRRPRYNDTTVVDLTTILYSGRATAFKSENTYGPVGFDVTTNTVTVTWNPALGQEKPPVRKGGWILDATVRNPFVTVANFPGTDWGPPFQTFRTGYPEPHGYFYRVVSVTEPIPQTNPPSVLLELQSPPRQSTLFQLRPNTPVQFYGVLVVMEGVVEVFEKGQGWKP
jgi:hypothetical protein